MKKWQCKKCKRQANFASLLTTVAEVKSILKKERNGMPINCGANKKKRDDTNSYTEVTCVILMHDRIPLIRTFQLGFER